MSILLEPIKQLIVFDTSTLIQSNLVAFQYLNDNIRSLKFSNFNNIQMYQLFTNNIVTYQFFKNYLKKSTHIQTVFKYNNSLYTILKQNNSFSNSYDKYQLFYSKNIFTSTLINTTFNSFSNN